MGTFICKTQDLFSQLRLVILDYPKLLISQEDSKKILADIIQAKQLNFERSCEQYVPLSGLDMVSTHFLIYDIKDLYNPKLILAIRNTYEDRACRHSLTIPSAEYIKFAKQEHQDCYHEFKNREDPW